MIYMGVGLNPDYFRDEDVFFDEFLEDIFAEEFQIELIGVFRVRKVCLEWAS